MADDEPIAFELACVEMVIANEIKQGATQTQVARTYARGMKSSDVTDWDLVGDIIIERWSIAGLKRIKEMAWSGKCFKVE